PEVDKDELEKRLAELKEEKLDEEMYTTSSWATYQEALSEAEKTLKNGEATQEDVDHSLETLNQAYDGLKKKDEQEDVDKSKLQSKVDDISELKSSDYTKQTWEALEEALKEA